MGGVGEGVSNGSWLSSHGRPWVLGLKVFEPPPLVYSNEIIVNCKSSFKHVYILAYSVSMLYNITIQEYFANLEMYATNTYMNRFH